MILYFLSLYSINFKFIFLPNIQHKMHLTNRNIKADLAEDTAQIKLYIRTFLEEHSVWQNDVSNATIKMFMKKEAIL